MDRFFYVFWVTVTSDDYGYLDITKKRGLDKTKIWKSKSEPKPRQISLCKKSYETIMSFV